jgi:predicted phosphatase
MSFKTTVGLVQTPHPKLYIFDLDETLWDGRQLYPGVSEILHTLQRQGHLVYIASFNNDVPGVLEYLNITKLFHGGSYGNNRSKYTMVKEIMIRVINRFKFLPTNVEFYDDLMSNICDVHSNSRGFVKSIYVQYPHGLKENHINSDMTTLPDCKK